MLPSIKKLYFYCYIFIACIGLVLVYPLSLIRRLIRKKPNSLWAGAPILTLPLKARAESMLGINAKSLVYESYGIAKHGFDINLEKWISLPIFGRFVPLLTFLFACSTQDRLHFFYDRGLLPPFNAGVFSTFELFAYKIFKIKTFFWAYGADVRTRMQTQTLGQINCCTFCPSVEKACVCLEDKGQGNYNSIYRLATKCFSMGDLVHYTPGSDNTVFYWPIDINVENGQKYQPVYPTGDAKKPLVIVHASNHRAFKGTNFLIKAVNDLTEEGYLIELRMIEKMPNVEALENYRLADIIFDQCLIGFHGYFALEGMALGKPVMSFIRNPNADLLEPNECPLINISTKTLKAEIVNFYKERSSLVEIGKRGRKYIETYYTLEAVSERMGLAFNNLRE